MRAPLLWSVLFVSCGAEEQSVDEAYALDRMPTPMVAAAHEGDFCGRIVAVTADGRVWAERGCENGPTVLRPTGRAVTGAERAQVDAAFRALPSGSGCPGSFNGNDEVVWLHRREGGERAIWVACHTSGAIDSPWREADAALMAVAPW